MYVHVFSADGQAKFWLEPAIELAINEGLPSQEVTAIGKIVEERADEIRDAWRKHFGS